MQCVCKVLIYISWMFAEIYFFILNCFPGLVNSQNTNDETIVSAETKHRCTRNTIATTSIIFFLNCIWLILHCRLLWNAKVVVFQCILIWNPSKILKSLFQAILMYICFIAYMLAFGLEISTFPPS